MRPEHGRSFRTIRVRFNIPPGERVPEEQRKRVLERLEKHGHGDLAARLVEGRPGSGAYGLEVTPEYRDVNHLASRNLKPSPGLPLYRLWDFGLSPTCVWTQTNSVGQWLILGCVRGENEGLEQLILHYVRPWEMQYLGDVDRYRIRDIGDASGRNREPSNSENSAARVLEEMLDSTFEVGPQDWDIRRSAIKAVLSRMHQGRGILQINPHPDMGGKIVRKALAGGAHYKKDGLGRVIDSVDSFKRASGIHSHPFDALCYGAAVLFPVHERYERQAPAPRAERKHSGPTAWMRM